MAAIGRFFWLYACLAVALLILFFSRISTTAISAAAAEYCGVNNHDHSGSCNVFLVSYFFAKEFLHWWDADKINATSAVAIALFTLSLMLSTKAQWKVAHQNFIATHRPKIIVRFVQGPALGKSGTTAYVTAVNIGETTATIFAVGLDLSYQWHRDDWAPPGLNASPEPIEEIVLQSGQQHTFKVVSRVSDHEFDARLGMGQKLVVVGVIRYRDGNGVERETGLLWDHESDRHRFTRSTDPEWHYQD